MLVVNQTHKFATKRIITINEIFIELRTSGNVIHSVRNERRYGFFVFYLIFISVSCGSIRYM